MIPWVGMDIRALDCEGEGERCPALVVMISSCEEKKVEEPGWEGWRF